MKFGQHQTFHLRINWLRKGISMIREDSRFFYDSEAAEKVGLGKNMVQSLRFWMTATNIVTEERDEEEEKIHRITDLGELIDRYDPYMTFEDTLSLIHFSLLDKPEPCTAWHWFFNIFENKAATKEELITELKNWVLQIEKKEPLENSIKRDIDCLIRLYLSEEVGDPEDVTQSPLSKLGLITENKGIVSKKILNYESIGLATLMYALLKFGEKWDVNNISIEEIEIGPNLWGKLFHLPRVQIIRALEVLEDHPIYPITFVRTNSLNNILLPKVGSMDFIRWDYHHKEEQFEWQKENKNSIQA